MNALSGTGFYLPSSMKRPRPWANVQVHLFPVEGALQCSVRRVALNQSLLGRQLVGARKVIVRDGKIPVFCNSQENWVWSNQPFPNLGKGMLDVWEPRTITCPARGLPRTSICAPGFDSLVDITTDRSTCAMHFPLAISSGSPARWGTVRRPRRHLEAGSIDAIAGRYVYKKPRSIFIAFHA